MENKNKPADIPLNHTNRAKDFINEREEVGEWEIEADSVSLKRNRALTHFTVERPQATPDPLIPKSVWVCMCVRNPLLVGIPLSCVSCSLLHCSATSNLLLGVSCTFKTEGVLVLTHLFLSVYEWMGNCQILVYCQCGSTNHWVRWKMSCLTDCFQGEKN